MRNELGLLIKLDRKENVENLLKRVVELGFHSCQVSTYVPSLYTQETADLIKKYCEEYDVKISLWWAGWPGKCEWNFVGGPATVGLVPLATRKERCDIMKKASDFSRMLGCDRIATHAGFIPEDMNDPLYKSLKKILPKWSPSEMIIVFSFSSCPKFAKVGPNIGCVDTYGNPHVS